jgi:hypothetical protein
MAWTPPTLAEFNLRFPELSAYDQVLAQYLLDDSNTRVAEGNWADHDKTPASLNLTAHRLVMSPGAVPGFDPETGGGSGGITPESGAVKSRTVGDVRVEYETKSDYIKGSSGGGVSGGAGPLGEFYLTVYGRHYLYIMKLNFPAVAVVYR